MGSGAREKAPPWPLVLECIHGPFDGPTTDALMDGRCQFVDSQLRLGQGRADGRDHLAASAGVNRTGSGWVGTDGGSAERAPTHIGRSTAATRCTVPRGPNVLIRVRSSHRARRMSSRVAPAIRRPMESSAALDHLGVSTADDGRDMVRGNAGRGSDEQVPLHPPCRHAGPGEVDRFRASLGHGRSVPLAASYDGSPPEDHDPSGPRSSRWLRP